MQQPNQVPTNYSIEMMGLDGPQDLKQEDIPPQDESQQQSLQAVADFDQKIQPNGNYPVFDAQNGGNPMQPHNYQMLYSMQPMQMGGMLQSTPQHLQNPQMNMAPQGFQPYHHQMAQMHQISPQQMMYQNRSDPNASFASSASSSRTNTPMPYAGRQTMQDETAFHGPMNIPLGEPLPTENFKLQVKNMELWRSFHELENEMILTKKGRKMFPNMAFKISGFDPKHKYNIAISFKRVDEHRYKWSDQRWTSVGKGELIEQNPMLYQREGMQLGEFWAKQDWIKFDKVKLTNTAHNIRDWIVCLRSMHKYIPYVYILRGEGDCLPNTPPHSIKQYVVQEFEIKCMEFVAVTAYNNDALKNLKVDNNKYAKGFRPEGRHSAKRRPEAQQLYGTPKVIRRDQPAPQMMPQPYGFTSFAPPQPISIYQAAMPMQIPTAQPAYSYNPNGMFNQSYAFNMPAGVFAPQPVIQQQDQVYQQNIDFMPQQLIQQPTQQEARAEGEEQEQEEDL
ncbi:hypothetical protein QR680_015877 [Steinernema hermaphroditum]|uniref:T-box domain-containing protein n=1 Tax=Steinernema hermaphroditum TaxID=289476 RepID=A0AA39LLN0_9BILA|nr:hypothetical protein QR680_015877 [Steinernema hermaphroditum]